PMKATQAFVLIFCTVLSALAAPHLMENLGRGVVAVRTSETETFVSWRMLGTDPSAIAFNLYRSTAGGAPLLLNATPITGATHFTDVDADRSRTNAYFVRPLIDGAEQASSAAFTLPANAPLQPYLRIPLQVPAPGPNYTYSPGDSSVGDVDGDGEYELVVKWDPSNAQDNSNAGVTGNVYLDGYKLDGTFLWRIDLGVNIRAGAHYTQFLVYDLDGDGRAELVCKTAPGTRDGTGTFIAQPGKFVGTPAAPIDHSADYRNPAGYILTGPEFFTIFEGATGAELATANYVVPRNNNPASGDVTAWGDDYGNRVDRFLACVAYLDGQRPSFVLCRGSSTRAVLAAWDWRGGQLTPRWVFDIGNSGTASPHANWRGQGAHSVTVGDVDGDGRDEITYGAAAIDDDGSGLYSTLLGHGDAEHLSDMDPTRPGQEVWMVHEDPGSYGPNGQEFRDAATGALIFGVPGTGADVGRGVAGDIDPRFLGYELWGARSGLMAVDGTQISATRPGQMNFMLWWDGDLLRELLDQNTVSKWDWNTSTALPLLSPPEVSSNNGTKANPALSGDILGDWREEVIWRNSNNQELILFTTTAVTNRRIHTLMHDPQYRLSIAWQNVGYNQPPHTSFFVGHGMKRPPRPDIVEVRVKK
ncbi:MAG TPA: rhamnogalacturonan lyase, partial [Opitutus sp.]|nr:rhamnogalacturonan lyase [Opitutus sp.]